MIYTAKRAVVRKEKKNLLAYSCPGRCTPGLVEASEGGKRRQFLQEKSPKKDLKKSSDLKRGYKLKIRPKYQPWELDCFECNMKILAQCLAWLV